jgi:hypothetical protein
MIRMSLLFSRSRHVCVVCVARRTFFPYFNENRSRRTPRVKEQPESTPAASNHDSQKGVSKDFHAAQSHLLPPIYAIERETKRAAPTCIFHPAAEKWGALFPLWFYLRKCSIISELKSNPSNVCKYCSN